MDPTPRKPGHLSGGRDTDMVGTPDAGPSLCTSSAGERLDCGFAAERLVCRWCEMDILFFEMEKRRHIEEAPTHTMVPASQSSPQRGDPLLTGKALLRLWEVRCPSRRDPWKSQDLKVGSQAGVFFCWATGH